MDALQLVVALDKNFGLKIPTPDAAKEILHSVNTIADAVQKKKRAKTGQALDAIMPIGMERRLTTL